MPIGRPLEFDPDQALAAAVEVFWERGYEASSISDLQAATGLSKSSLYQAFGGKQQLFERCLARYADDLSGQLRAALARAGSGRRFIEATFEAVAGTARGPAGARGCLLANSASELGQRDPALAGPVADGLARFTGVFEQAVRKAQADGELPRATDARALATCLIVAMNGLRTLIKAGADRRTARAAARLLLKTLD